MGGGSEVLVSGEGRRVTCEVRSEREGAPDSVGGGRALSTLKTNGAKSQTELGSRREVREWSR